MNTKSWAIAILLNTLPVFVYGQGETTGGTVILIYGDTSQVVVAADSRITLDDSIPLSDSACKITVFGNNVVFVASGIYSSPMGFDILKIAKNFYDSIPNFQNFPHIGLKFFEYAADELNWLIDTIRIVDSTKGKSFLGRVSIEFAWIILGNDQITVDTYTIRAEHFKGKGVTNSGDGMTWHSKSSHRLLWLPLGINGFNKGCMSAESAQRFLQTYGYIKGIVRLIENDIGFAPIQVGGEVDVLFVDGTGAHWQHRKPYCKACEECQK
jgi:hypothetical protein